ncbi:MAG: M56 family metallopeptidase, partial [Clostridia bacterium]|nr:M56 family metallopeptidase [Clostridia bacterium]
AQPLGGGLWRSDKVTGPAVYGVIRPRIIFPAGGEADEYALRHERAHVRRLDNLWRMIAFVTAALHWFNPFFWVLLRVFLSDLELACDETALRGLDGEQRRAYALALVESSRSKDVFASAFGGARVRMRVERVLSYKGMTWFSAAAFLLLTGVVAFILITNPR